MHVNFVEEETTSLFSLSAVVKKLLIVDFTFFKNAVAIQHMITDIIDAVTTAL